MRTRSDDTISYYFLRYGGSVEEKRRKKATPAPQVLLRPHGHRKLRQSLSFPPSIPPFRLWWALSGARALMESVTVGLFDDII